MLSAKYFNEQFGIKVGSFRIAAGMSQEILAFNANLTRKKLQRLETGVVEPKLYDVICLTNALRINIYDLIPEGFLE
jgi:DNA-binding XRE family transcriptional regulator